MSQANRLAVLLAAAALGAAAMYVLDPDKGRRRRAIGRDKMRSYVGRARSFANSAARDANHRLQGVRARMRRRFGAAPAADDLRLIERARAAMGRVVSHPHAVQIGASQGRLVLSGPILATEVPFLLAAMHLVPGVTEIDDHLVAHPSAESIPALQDGAARHADNGLWTPTARAAAIVGGGALALSGVRTRSWLGLALAAIGVALTARGATNRAISLPSPALRPRRRESVVAARIQPSGCARSARRRSAPRRSSPRPAPCSA